MIEVVCLKSDMGKGRLMDTSNNENMRKEATPITPQAGNHELEQRLRNSERKLAKHVGQLEAVFEAMADGVIVFDGRGHLQQMNRAACDLLGLDGQPDYSLHVALEHPSPYEVRDEQGQLLSVEHWPLLRVLKGEVLTGATAMDVIIRTRDGREVQLNVSGAPVRDQHGQIGGAVMVMRDVTERRHLERRAHEALHALLMMAQMIVHGPEDGNEISEQAGFVTRGVARRLAELTCSVLGCQRLSITTIEPESGLLRPLAVVGLSPEQEQQWWTQQEQQESRLVDGLDPSLVQRLRAGEVVLLDMTQLPWSSFPNPFEIHAMLVAPMSIRDHLIGLLALDYGAKEHVYTSEELALTGAVAKLTALMIEHERVVQERTEAYARELLLRETKERTDEFLGIASHELRTPLTTIKGNIQLARMQLMKCLREAGEDTLRSTLEEIHTMLERAERQVNVQNRMVSDLLNLAHIQAGKLELRLAPCDLAAIVRETVEDQRSATPTRIIHLELAEGEEIPVIADAERIEQVISNYLINALKYSPEDRPVEVRLEKEGKMARVSVHDEGPGLTPLEQEQVWEQYFRVPGITKQRGFSMGLGLGLYICRAIIKQHQGEVGVESTKGLGSTFWFTVAQEDI